MKLVRAIVFIVSLVLLAGGYAVSQASYFHDAVSQNISASLADFAASADFSSSAVEFLALTLLLACVVFPFVGKPGGTVEP